MLKVIFGVIVLKMMFVCLAMGSGVRLWYVMLMLLKVFLLSSLMSDLVVLYIYVW